ncbi:putative mediator of RNA polymerase II transcription subunit 15 [Drosophila nasuta]|uniref:putative mediator of RNA polymerase II transcription subunit 15 n=1 Tax=Drosophila nasuta TaxID=42062 RepID=UPI00295F2DCB|nr:putative mediator of RNA polymerase II transcription subunit 15 [Drosophila nasuta]
MPQAGRTSINNSYSYEWISLLVMLILPSFTTTQFASSLYNRQFYDHNQQQVQQQQGFVYPDAPVTYNQKYPASGQSVWSSAPIVVNDEANSLQLEQQQQDRHYLPINYYSNRETDRRQTNWMNDNDNENYNYNVPTTRAANHNYNNVPGYFYPTQQQIQHQVQPQSQQEVEQRELLAVADSHREEEQIVRIGGSRSLSPIPNDYFDAPQSLQRRDFEAKYAKHFADYVRKYPQRLQPLFNTGTPYVDK